MVYNGLVMTQDQGKRYSKQAGGADRKGEIP